MVTMTYNYIRRPPARASALDLSKRIDAKKQKLERYGGCLPNLEREIKQAESLLDNYLIKGAQEALESLDKLQADLNEMASREAAGYLTSEQIVQANAIKSHLGTLLSNR